VLTQPSRQWCVVYFEVIVQCYQLVIDVVGVILNETVSVDNNRKDVLTCHHPEVISEFNEVRDDEKNGQKNGVHDVRVSGE